MADTPSKQKENPQDILIVRNIDIDCDHIDSQSARRSTRHVDEEGRVMTGYTDDIEEVPHNQYFQVRWSGQRFRIKPGETRLYPRYIAEHFAKHLTDHMLGRQEVKSKQTGKEISLINSPTERKKMWDEIVVGVQQYFEESGELDEGTQALNEVEELNSSPMAAELGLSSGKVMDLGEDRGVQEVNKDPMGTAVSKDLIDTAELITMAVDDPNEPAPTGIEPDTWAKTTKAEYIQQIRQLDPFAKLTGNESKAVLVSKLKGF